MVIPVRRTKRLGGLYLSQSGIIEFFSALKSKKPTEKCVCRYGICPSVIPLNFRDLGIIIVQGWAIQLVLTVFILSNLSENSCSRSELLPTLPCRLVNSGVTVILVSFVISLGAILLRGILAGCTKSVISPRGKGHLVVYINAIVNVLVFLVAIIYMLINYSILFSIVVSFSLSVLLDWVLGPFLGLLCCWNFLCVREFFIVKKYWNVHQVVHGDLAEAKWRMKRGGGYMRCGCGACLLGIVVPCGLCVCCIGLGFCGKGYCSYCWEDVPEYILDYELSVVNETTSLNHAP